MGKAAKLKALRKMAGNMPPLKTKGIEVERVAGSELIKQGITEVEGRPVDHEKTYRKFKEVAVPLNHYKRMKSMYKKGHSVAPYMNAVDAHVKQQAVNE